MPSDELHGRTGSVKCDASQPHIEDLHTHNKLNKFGGFENI